MEQFSLAPEPCETSLFYALRKYMIKGIWAKARDPLNHVGEKKANHQTKQTKISHIVMFKVQTDSLRLSLVATEYSHLHHHRHGTNNRN